MLRRVSWWQIGSVALWGATVMLTLSGLPQYRSVPVDSPSSASSAAVDRSATTGMHGVAMNVHHVTDTGPFRDAIDETAALGADSLLIVTPMYQVDGSSSEVGHDRSRCPAPEVLEELLTYAGKRHGLKTGLMPIVLLEHPRSNEWRGRIAPSDWDGWWESYTAQIVSFGVMAERSGVDLLFVGSELNSTERMTDRWESVIAAVRGVFGGSVSYSANWDRYQKVGYWKWLDVIGVSAWYDVSPEGKYAISLYAAADDPEGRVDPVERAWERIRVQLLRFAGEQGRPVLISEIGYPSLPWGLKDPWNYVVKEGDGVSEPDYGVQAQGFNAFFAAWDDAWGVDALAAGFFCYEWKVGRGRTPFGYGVSGKPAEDVWRRAFREIERMREGE